MRNQALNCPYRKVNRRSLAAESNTCVCNIYFYTFLSLIFFILFFLLLLLCFLSWFCFFLSLLFAFVFVLFCQLIHWFSRLLIIITIKIRNVFLRLYNYYYGFAHTMTHAFNTHMTQSSSSFNAHAPHTESQTTNRTPALNDREKFIESAQTPIRKNQRKKRRTKNTKKKTYSLSSLLPFPLRLKIRLYVFDVCMRFFLLLLFHNFSVRSSR